MFLAVARSGTTTAAARTLGVNQSTVSRRLKQLESDAGVAVFERQSSGLHLTEAGREMVEAAEQIARRILDTAPIARAQWKRMVNAKYGWVDEPTLAASIRAPECAEGFRSFVEKRPPSWVPSPLPSSD